MQEPRFDWREVRQIRLFVDGAEFYPQMLEAIRRARHSLMLEFYLTASGALMGQFTEALMSATKRGVSVFLLFDHYGARNLSRSNRQQLLAAGVQLVFYNPLSLNNWSTNFSRDHRKLLIADQELAFIGGAGLTDQSWKALKSRPLTPWHEVMCSVEGPVVRDLVILFSRLWKRCTSYWPEPLQVGSRGGNDPSGRIRVLTAAGPARQDIIISVLRQTRAAQHRVWICTAYFMPSFALRLALRRAARRGLDVRVLVAGPLTDHRWIYYASKRYYRRLLKAGVRIFEYQPRMLHAKMAIIDDRVSIGSCNLDHWNLRWNLEANVEVDEPAFTHDVETLFMRDFGESREITAGEWRRRPWHRKLRELVWAMVCQWVLRIR